MQLDKLLHGGDYNPEQWLDRPDILAKDVELMEKAHVNVVTLGVFSWSTLEPSEGDYQLDWLADIIDSLWAAGNFSAARAKADEARKWNTIGYIVFAVLFVLSVIVGLAYSISLAEMSS